MSHHGSHQSENQFHIMKTEDHSTELGHVVPFRIYLGVLLSLLVLTVLTVVVSRFDFGSMNLVVAMVVASIKATLVICFFMHLKFENKFTIGYAAFPLVLLALLMGGIFIDNPFRSGQNGKSEIEAYSGGRIDYSAGHENSHAPGHDAQHADTEHHH